MKQVLLTMTYIVETCLSLQYAAFFHFITFDILYTGNNISRDGSKGNNTNDYKTNISATTMKITPLTEEVTKHISI